MFNYERTEYRPLPLFKQQKAMQHAALAVTPGENDLFVGLFAWCLTAHQHKKAISAKNR